MPACGPADRAPQIVEDPAGARSRSTDRAQTAADRGRWARPDRVFHGSSAAGSPDGVGPGGVRAGCGRAGWWTVRVNADVRIRGSRLGADPGTADPRVAASQIVEDPAGACSCSTDRAQTAADRGKSARRGVSTDRRLPDPPAAGGNAGRGQGRAGGWGRGEPEAGAGRGGLGPGPGRAGPGRPATSWVRALGPGRVRARAELAGASSGAGGGGGGAAALPRRVRSGWVRGLAAGVAAAADTSRSCWPPGLNDPAASSSCRRA